MGFLGKLFGKKEKKIPASFDVALEALEQACQGIKHSTGASWLNILPAVQDIGVQLSVELIGIEAVRKQYSELVRQADGWGRVPVMAHIEYSKPPLAPNLESAMKGMLWGCSANLAKRGVEIPLIAHVYRTWPLAMAEKISTDDQIARCLLAEVVRGLERGNYNEGVKGNPTVVGTA
jgi:hypothetical protein